MTPDERILRGERARQLLEDPVMKDALDSLEKRYTEELLRVSTWTRWGDRKRRALADRVNAVRELRAVLEAEMAMGRQAAQRSFNVV